MFSFSFACFEIARVCPIGVVETGGGVVVEFDIAASPVPSPSVASVLACAHIKPRLQPHAVYDNNTIKLSASHSIKHINLNVSISGRSCMGRTKGS